MTGRLLVGFAFLATAAGWLAVAGIYATPWVSVPAAIASGFCIAGAIVAVALGRPRDWLS